MRSRRALGALVALATMGLLTTAAGATSGGHFEVHQVFLQDHGDYGEPYGPDDLYVQFTERGVGRADATVTGSATRTVTSTCSLGAGDLDVRIEIGSAVAVQRSFEPVPIAESTTSFEPTNEGSSTSETTNGAVTGMLVFEREEPFGVCEELAVGLGAVGFRFDETHTVTWSQLALEDTGNRAMLQVPGSWTYEEQTYARRDVYDVNAKYLTDLVRQKLFEIRESAVPLEETVCRIVVSSGECRVAVPLPIAL